MADPIVVHTPERCAWTRMRSSVPARARYALVRRRTVAGAWSVQPARCEDRSQPWPSPGLIRVSRSLNCSRSRACIQRDTHRKGKDIHDSKQVTFVARHEGQRRDENAHAARKERGDLTDLRDQPCLNTQTGNTKGTPPRRNWRTTTPRTGPGPAQRSLRLLLSRARPAQAQTAI